MHGSLGGEAFKGGEIIPLFRRALRVPKLLRNLRARHIPLRDVGFVVLR